MYLIYFCYFKIIFVNEFNECIKCVKFIEMIYLVWFKIESWVFLLFYFDVYKYILKLKCILCNEISYRFLMMIICFNFFILIGILWLNEFWWLIKLYLIFSFNFFVICYFNVCFKLGLFFNVDIFFKFILIFCLFNVLCFDFLNVFFVGL